MVKGRHNMIALDTKVWIRYVTNDHPVQAERALEMLHRSIVVSSGFGDAAVSSRLAREEVAGLVSKPYNLDQLRGVLRRVLD